MRGAPWPPVRLCRPRGRSHWRQRNQSPRRGKAGSSGASARRRERRVGAAVEISDGTSDSKPLVTFPHRRTTVSTYFPLFDLSIRGKVSITTLILAFVIFSDTHLRQFHSSDSRISSAWILSTRISPAMRGHLSIRTTGGGGGGGGPGGGPPRSPPPLGQRAPWCFGFEALARAPQLEAWKGWFGFSLDWKRVA